jgi:hypothetical protein
LPISIDHAKQIQSITADLGDVIRDCNPVSTKEWDAFNSLVSAHKNMMKIDPGEFMQLPMDLDPAQVKDLKPRKDCPRCGGSGIFNDPAAPADPGRPCNCKDVEKAAWSRTKADWKKLLEPV